MNPHHLVCFLQSSSHGGQPCNIFKAFALSHKGKATSDVQYNSKDALRPTTTRPSIAASRSTHRWRGRFMGLNMIQPPRSLTQKSS